MKSKYKASIVMLILLTFLLSLFPSNASVKAEKDMRGLWVASVLNIDYPSKPTTDSEVLRNEALKILDDAKKAGINAVFLQVRPSSDSFYKSAYFPWSKYLTGTQGKAPDNNFDPLTFWVSEAHKRDIELHAWVNPYRVTKKTDNESTPTTKSLEASHPARLHPDWVVQHTDKNLYFNPGIPEVRKLIVDSVVEIVKNYDIDGIHFDDYFYPSRTFNDTKTFVKYGKGYSNIGDWRRANVNLLVSDVSKAIKKANKNVRFGISPFGIWANKSTNSLGMDTKGLESYYDHYADSRKWVKDGMIDYIAPQIYWNIGYSIADYSKILNWWKDVAKGTNVDLYVGHAAYKAANSSSSSPWYGVDEIGRQLLLNEKTPEVKGSIFYNYTALKNTPALGALIKAVYDKRDNKRDGSSTSTSVTVSRPAKNITTTYSSYYLNGASDSGTVLYLNGKPVENRSQNGYFGILVPLEKGSNIFTFSQGGSYVTRVIYRNTGSTQPAKLSKAEITASSVFPQATEYRMPGEKITLTCTAPTGSKVTVKIGGKTFNMKSSSSSSTASLIPAKYTYTYTIPSYSGAPRNIDLGSPVYTMNYKGTVQSRKAPAKVGVVMQNSPFYAEVSKEDIDTFATPNSSNGASYELRKGMVDYVTGITGDYVRLLSGLWVRKTSVALYSSKTQLSSSVKSASYNIGDKWDTIKLNYSSSLAATASFDSTNLKVNITSVSSGVIPQLPANGLLTKAEFSKKGNMGQYSFTIRQGKEIDGYYIEKTATGILLHVKRQVKTSKSGGPLSGITIMLDPGHGGSDSGAVGPLINYPEKDINLKTSLKLRDELEALGAKVLMTRTSDIAVSLSDRLTASRNSKPDMFLSIHANSMADNVDISKINGFSVHYKEALSKTLSTLLANQSGEIGRRNRGIKYDNFYVVRGTWTPSMLIECGFVPNPDEFELLTNEYEQTKLAKSLAEGIARYFSR